MPMYRIVAAQPSTFIVPIVPCEGVVFMITHHRLGYALILKLSHQGNSFWNTRSPIDKVAEKDDLAFFLSQMPPGSIGTPIPQEVQHTVQRINIAVDVSNYVKHPCN
jgi:hypothetical protein